MKAAAIQYNPHDNIFLGEGDKYNKIYYNNFYNSAIDKLGCNSTNTWYKHKIIGKSMGNYWDDYEKLYPNAKNDGTVWDTPYDIEDWYGDPAQDKYPVVSPFDIENIDLSNFGMSEELTSEESELLVQIEETINSQILSEELNINNLMNSYMHIVSTTRSSPTSR